ncbi:response regulator [Ferranicluibacter rubi]|uniref:Response regulator n=1 Tax=Ferranicluibacter rubi TaxID=2715133 RepID=A0AA44C904_9HYPH|nr:response regulator [Ferranicluibacter rubi]NHT74253.1 response regulator [Ferranicluibacter rubi]TCP89118.1 response regulator receiver domain-containing protein [Rhizobium sp. PP-CC-2G-626]TCQ12015.1 response regulator receiver domain-containing protein [Rhizobium sp. PP-F2F-G36]TCQ29199.1 response regulator receiver domain-containing protein [Rhizobium sp. PP-CC-3G-465]
MSMPTPVQILLIDDEPAEHVILRRLMSKVQAFAIQLHYCETIEAALPLLERGTPVSMVLVDNRLPPHGDFRDTVPQIRQKGFIGPVGVISGSLDDAYFQSFQEFGVDFRLDKAELDPTAIEFLLQEYLVKS